MRDIWLTAPLNHNLRSVFLPTAAFNLRPGSRGRVRRRFRLSAEPLASTDIVSDGSWDADSDSRRVSSIRKAAVKYIEQ